MLNDLPLNIIVSRKYLPLFHTSYPPGCARCDYNEPNKKRELSNLVQLLGRCEYMYTFRQLILYLFHMSKAFITCKFVSCKQYFRINSSRAFIPYVVVQSPE